MPFVLRKVSKSRWYREQKIPWLADDDVPADALKDLATSDNALSVWQVDDDKSNLDRVITALAATCHSSTNIDYAMVDRQRLESVNLSIKHLPGDTPDEEANKHWHHDVVELSGLKLVDLARAFRDGAAIIERKMEKDVLRLLANAVAHGQVDPTRLKEALRVKVEKLNAKDGG